MDSTIKAQILSSLGIADYGINDEDLLLAYMSEFSEEKMIEQYHQNVVDWYRKGMSTEQHPEVPELPDLYFHAKALLAQIQHADAMFLAAQRDYDTKLRVELYKAIVDTISKDAKGKMIFSVNKN